MATSKSQPKKVGAAKKSAKKSARSAATLPGNVPPYGEPIRQAIARGDVNEMKRLAASTKIYVGDLQAALLKLDQALGSLKK